MFYFTKLFGSFENGRMQHEFVENAPFWILIDPSKINAKGFIEKIPGDKKRTLVVKPENNMIKIDHIKEVYPFLEYQDEGTRILIIEDAHLMNHFAQNALLKIFEKNYSRVYVFLITSQLNKIIPTIQSRFFKKFFANSEDYPHREWLDLKGGDNFLERIRSMVFSKNGNFDLIKGITEPDYFLDVLSAILYKEIISEKINVEKGVLAYEKLNRFMIEANGAHLNPEDQMIAGIVIVQMIL